MTTFSPHNRGLLTLSHLAPEIAEAILRGEGQRGLSLENLTGDTPALWKTQLAVSGFGVIWPQSLQELAFPVASKYTYWGLVDAGAVEGPVWLT